MVAWRAIIGDALAKDRLTVSSTTRRTYWASAAARPGSHGLRDATSSATTMFRGPGTKRTV